MKNPIQPVIKDLEGKIRFKSNSIVYYLYQFAKDRGCGLNEIADMPFNKDDRQQFAQLLGYDLCGYSELHYVTDKTYALAESMAPKEKIKKSTEKTDLRSRLLAAADQARTHCSNMTSEERAELEKEGRRMSTSTK